MACWESCRHIATESGTAPSRHGHPLHPVIAKRNTNVNSIFGVRQRNIAARFEEGLTGHRQSPWPCETVLNSMICFPKLPRAGDGISDRWNQQPQCKGRKLRVLDQNLSLQQSQRSGYSRHFGICRKRNRPWHSDSYDEPLQHNTCSVRPTALSFHRQIRIQQPTIDRSCTIPTESL